MALKERRVFDCCEVLASGDIQVVKVDEIYDDQTGDIKSRSLPIRNVVASDDITPNDVQAFLDNSKAN